MGNKKNDDETKEENDDQEPIIEIYSKRKKSSGKRRKILKLILHSAFLFISGMIFIGVLILFGTYIKYAHDFDSKNPESNSTQLVFYDKNGKEIFRDYGAAEPQRMALKDIPDVVKQATLAAEDEDFYKHGPVDFKGIARAAYINWRDSDKQGLSRVGDLFNSSSYSQGGSTITQQLVKNVYLTPERSFNRKISEIVFAYKLEHKYSKDKILEMYLNEIYYGAQALGINNASRIYFDKDVKDLDLAEASMLAGLPQAPSYYSPLGDNYDAAKKRQEYVLQKMYLAGNINLDQAKEAANEPLNIIGRQVTLDKYPYFNAYVKEQLSKKFDINNLENKGMKVYTTLDPTIQEGVEKRVKEEMVKLAARGASNAAVVVADPKTNNVLAMVGGTDWDKSKVNVSTSLRQPGSSFKPFVYATALENGFSAATILNDKYVNFGGNPPYIPHNYDGGYHGYVTIRNALAMSLNIPAVEMGKLVGIEKVIETAHKMGISSINEDPATYGLTVSLGSAEVKLADMVNAYSVFADNGLYGSQGNITKIIDSKGEEILPKRAKKKQVISAETSYIISSILSDNNARSGTFGTFSPLKTDKTTAVKTGTTDNYSDSWTMGYTPSYVVGVWMGNNDHKPMKNVSGVEGAAYIWHDVISDLTSTKVDEPFIKPTGIKESWINPRTGTLATFQGKPNLLEYFKDGMQPKDKVDLSYLKQF